MLENITEVFDFYEKGAELGRLERGLGVIEAARTKEIISRYIKPGMTVYDVGGGVGYYADWLAEQGCGLPQPIYVHQGSTLGLQEHSCCTCPALWAARPLL